MSFQIFFLPTFSVYQASVRTGCTCNTRR